MIGMLKSMATTMKHALGGEKFTVEYPDDTPDVSPRFRGETSGVSSGYSTVNFSPPRACFIVVAIDLSIPIMVRRSPTR